MRCHGGSKRESPEACDKTNKACLRQDPVAAEVRRSVFVQTAHACNMSTTKRNALRSLW